jgi:hypothetical protein
MSKQDMADFTKKIKYALIYSSKKMFEEKLKNDSIMAISRNGQIIVAKASEIAKLPD